MPLPKIKKEIEDKVKSYYGRYGLAAASSLCGVPHIYVLYIWSTMKNKNQPNMEDKFAKIEEFMVKCAEKHKKRNQLLGYKNIFESEYDEYDNFLEKYGFVTKKKTTKYNDHTTNNFV
ncbi:hypothetical protein ACQ4LE_001667 [Meloidogyne hapla]|uniref:Uncharacterized protein n=1 Tax=Meloidogyne hapla TaxID=6305 RepID=A0A1I8BEA4_MELHA